MYKGQCSNVPNHRDKLRLNGIGVIIRTIWFGIGSQRNRVQKLTKVIVSLVEKFATFKSQF